MLKINTIAIVILITIAIITIIFPLVGIIIICLALAILIIPSIKVLWELNLLLYQKIAISFLGLIVAILVISFLGFFLGTFALTKNFAFIEGYKIETFYHLAGIVSGLFSALAFAGVLYSLHLQNKERIKQQENFDRQLEEQDRHASQQINNLNNQLEFAKEQFAQQTKYDEIKRFEDTFFKMISLQLEIVNGLEYSYIPKDKTETENRTITGRQVFKSMFIEEHQFFILDENELNRYTKVGDKAFTSNGSKKGINSLHNLLDTEGLSVYKKVSFIGILDHYFRNLYCIIKFVHQQDNKLLSDGDKYRYISNNVRSILSEYELIMLFYNCLTKAGYNKFKPLIERYTLFKNIQQNHFTVINEPLSDKYINKIFPMNKFEEYLDIDNTIIVDEYRYIDGINNTIHYKLQAFYKENEIMDKQKTYQKLRKEQDEREESYHRNIKQN